MPSKIVIRGSSLALSSDAGRQPIFCRAQTTLWLDPPSAKRSHWSLKVTTPILKYSSALSKRERPTTTAGISSRPCKDYLHISGRNARRCPVGLAAIGRRNSPRFWNGSSDAHDAALDAPPRRTPGPVFSASGFSPPIARLSVVLWSSPQLKAASKISYSKWGINLGRNGDSEQRIDRHDVFHSRSSPRVPLTA